MLGSLHGYVLSRSVEVPGQQPGQPLLNQVTTQHQLQAVQAHLQDLQEVSATELSAAAVMLCRCGIAWRTVSYPRTTKTPQTQ